MQGNSRFNGLAHTMNSKRSRRLRKGDVIEFPTSKGFVYLQVTHNHRAPPHWSWYSRLLPGFHQERPSNLELLTTEPSVFGIFCPFLNHYECVANLPIPEFAQRFPMFKRSPVMAGPEPPRPGMCWQIWVADEDSPGVTYLCWNVPTWAVDFPLEQLVDDVLLRKRIESGWTPAEGITEAHLNYDIRFEDLELQPTEEDFNEFCRNRPDPDISFRDAWGSGWRPENREAL